ncbi:MAG: alpha/beta hydrolase family protein [Acidimicrobiales bacterium]
MILLGAVAWAGLSGGGAKPRLDPPPPHSTTIGSHGRTTTTAPRPKPTTTTTIPPPSLVASQYVGTFNPTFVDQVTGVSVPTEVFYPATSSGGPPVTGRHPLIVFAEGFDALPSYYSDLIATWAKAGFVVAAPVFPYTNANANVTPASENHLIEQPGEVSTVISSMLTLGHSPNNVLQGIIDPMAIGLAGQSDGGDTVSAVAYDSCCTYPGIGATAILSGQELENPAGSYFNSPSPSPMLVVQGMADTINPPANSDQLYNDDGGGEKYYLKLTGGFHLTPYTLDQTALGIFVPPGHTLAQLTTMAQAELPVVEQVTTDFFEAELVPASGVTASTITAAGNVAGTSTIVSANLGGGSGGGGG